MEERNMTSRASFKCPGCKKTFTDLEAGQLFDPFTGEMNCTYCHVEVEEDTSVESKADARNLMVKFNEQIEPIFNLLREVEDVKLSQELLEPEPVDLGRRCVCVMCIINFNKASRSNHWCIVFDRVSTKQENLHKIKYRNSF
jgi:hypothetical protein